VEHFNRRSFAGRTDKLSIVLVASDEERDKDNVYDLQQQVMSYAQINFVRSITVLWPHTKKMPGKLPKKAYKTKIYTHIGTSPNARFHPHLLDTQHFLLIDGSITVASGKLETMFALAQENPGQLVTPSVGSLGSDDGIEFGQEKHGLRHSLADTRMVIMRTDYLFLYSCVADTRLLAMVQRAGACEDLVLNVISSVVSGHPPRHIISKEDHFAEFRAPNRQQPTVDVSMKRKQCVADLQEFLKAPDLHLRESVGSVQI
jgi:hypothetical protein